MKIYLEMVLELRGECPECEMWSEKFLEYDDNDEEGKLTTILLSDEAFNNNRAELVGKKIKCPNCNTILEIEYISW